MDASLQEYFIQQNGLGALGTNWFKKTFANVHKFAQQTDLVSHALTDAGVGKTTVGKVLVPSTINVDKYQTIVKSDKPKPVLTTVDATNCSKPEFTNDPRCVEFMAAQNQVQTSQAIIAVPENKISTKTKVIVGGALGITALLIVLAIKKSK